MIKRFILRIVADALTEGGKETNLSASENKLFMCDDNTMLNNLQSRHYALDADFHKLLKYLNLRLETGHQIQKREDEADS